MHPFFVVLSISLQILKVKLLYFQAGNIYCSSLSADQCSKQETVATTKSSKNYFNEEIKLLFSFQQQALECSLSMLTFHKVDMISSPQSPLIKDSNKNSENILNVNRTEEGCLSATNSFLPVMMMMNTVKSVIKSKISELC